MLAHVEAVVPPLVALPTSSSLLSTQCLFVIGSHDPYTLLGYRAGETAYWRVLEVDCRHCAGGRVMIVKEEVG